MKSLLEQGRKARLRSLVKDVMKQVTILEHKYVDLEYISQIIQEENLRLVHAEWLLQNGASRFQRQQDLPKEAHWGFHELGRQKRMTEVVAVSYCWLHPNH